MPIKFPIQTILLFSLDGPFDFPFKGTRTAQLCQNAWNNEGHQEKMRIYALPIPHDQ
jgi:hypothetical protein